MLRRLPALTCLIVFIAATLMITGVARAESASFQECENALDGARFRHTATKITAGPEVGKVIIVGGDSESSATPTGTTSVYSSCFIYDPDTNSFTQVASLNVARTLHSAVALPDGRILVAGGFNGSNELSSTEIYDPINNTWSLAGYLNTSRSNFTLTLLYTGGVIAMGGKQGDSALSSCEIYDFNADSWVPTQPLASGRYNHAAILMQDGSVMVAGGNKSAALANDTYQIFTPPTDTVNPQWTVPATLPFSFDSSYQYVYGLLDSGEIVIGTSNSGGRALVFDGSSWSQAGTQTPRWGGTQLKMATNNIVEIGGWGNAKVVDIYLPVSNKWNTYNSIHGHTFAQCVLLDNGNILLAAGNSSGNSELLVPSTVAKPSTVMLDISSAYGTPLPVNSVAYTTGTTVTCEIQNTTFTYNGRTYECTGYTGAGSAPSGSGTSTTFTITGDSSLTWNWRVTGGTYRLEVTSAHGTPSPAVGTNTIASGTVINATVDQLVEPGGGIRYLCTGFEGTGSVPTDGSGNQVTFTLESNSTLLWVWQTQYRLQVTNVRGIGSPYPPIGDNWFPAGQVINGNITSPSGNWEIAGFVGTGSLANDVLPSFSIVIDQPTSVDWRWMETGMNNVSLAINSKHGTPTPSGVMVYTSGAEVNAEVPAFVETGGTRYECIGWSGTGSVPIAGNTNTVTFDLYEKSVINWEWDTYYLLTVVNNGALGSPSPSAGSYWMLDGTPITANVTSPTGGYFCTGYTGTGDITSGSATQVAFTLSQATTIQWNWVPISQVNTQLVVKSDYGAPTPPVGTNFYFSGATVNASIEKTVMGQPGELFICTGWTGTGSVGFQDTNPETGLTFFKRTGPETSLSFTILNQDPDTGAPYNNTLTFNWERRYYLTVINEEGMPKSIPASGKTPILAGSNVTASVPPSASMAPGLRVFCIGYIGTGSVPASGTESTVTFDMGEPSSIEWLWEDRYEVIVENPAGFGNPVPVAGTYYVKPGDSFSAQIESTYGPYTLLGHFVETDEEIIESEENFVTVTVEGPVRITWNWDFIPVEWQIPLNVDTGQSEVPFYVDLERSPETSSPWICYQDIASKDLHVVFYSVDQWVNQNLDSFGEVGAFSNLKVDEMGDVHMAYYDETNQTLKVAERIRGVWNINTADPNQGNGRYCSIAGSPEGKWGIAYLDNSNLAQPVVKYAQKFQNDWLIEQAKQFDGVVEYLQLIYYNEEPLIVFYDATAGKLKYLYYDGEWILDTIDSTPDVGRFCHAALDPISGQPAVAYYDLTNSRLKYAIRRPDFTWNIQVVDDTGDVGYYPNLVFDKTGKPSISYQSRKAAAEVRHVRRHLLADFNHRLRPGQHDVVSRAGEVSR
ncbi:MAG: kelch repeat-containing protein [Planctomycetota bacterium]|nr:kelch repeat-containing protein [Planctomycetota bacterium]